MFTKCLEPFHHIAGSTDGTQSHSEVVISLLDFIQEVDDSPVYNEFFPTMAKYWRELAMDLANGDDMLDIDHYSELVSDLCADVLPASCSFEWCDGEFRINPFIDCDLPRFDECPESFNGDDFIYTVNDHGNVDCYEWNHGDNEWKLVWSIV